MRADHSSMNASRPMEKSTSPAGRLPKVGWASAGSHDMGATTFGLARQSAENPSASDVSPDTVQDNAL